MNLAALSGSQTKAPGFAGGYLLKGLSLIIEIAVHRSGNGLEVSMGKVVELRHKFTEKDVVWDGEEKMWRHDFRIPANRVVKIYDECRENLIYDINRFDVHH